MIPQTKTLITPLNSINSHIAKLAYPIYNNIIISKITDSVRNLKLLNKNDVNNPNIQL